MPNGGDGVTPDEMRCAQADRDRCADVLKAAWVEGRLRDDEYEDRRDRVLQALTYGELNALVRDLPTGALPGAPAPQPSPPYPVPPHAPHAPYPGGPRPHVWGYPQYVMRPAPASGLAVTSLVVGIVSIVVMWPASAILFGVRDQFNWVPFVSAAVAIVTGHLALYQARTRPDGRRGGTQLAVAGSCLGWIQVVCAALAALPR